jgi:hypothetical protein
MYPSQSRKMLNFQKSNLSDHKFEASLVLMDVCFSFNELETSDVENDTVGAKSSLEMRQERLRARLEQLEEQALAEKPWQMKGEVSASSRPQNSLLEEVLEFDLTARPGELSVEEVRSTHCSCSLYKHVTNWLVNFNIGWKWPRDYSLNYRFQVLKICISITYSEMQVTVLSNNNFICGSVLYGNRRGSTWLQGYAPC